VVESKDSREAYANYQAVLKLIGPQAVRSLRSDRHDGIALHGAWEDVHLILPARRQQEAVHPRGALLNRFLGFVEGRMQCPTPSWWEETVLQMRAYDRNTLLFPEKSIKLVKMSGTDFFGTRDMSLTTEKQTATLKVGRDIVKISSSAFRRMTQVARTVGSQIMSARMNPEKCLVAIHGDQCWPYSLYCIDRKDGTVLWTNNVWAGGDNTNYGGPAGWHRISICWGMGRIIVFGAGDDVAYVEVFEAGDGKNLSRFSTSY
jgi:hypothetical protein